jgi:hypothetical protein
MAKFDLEKFMEFELGNGMSTSACIKCAAACAMGREVIPRYTGLGAVSYIFGGVRKMWEGVSNHNFFTREAGLDFTMEMDQAELDLIFKKLPPEAIKLNVIKAAIKAGLVEQSEAKEYVNAC